MRAKFEDQVRTSDIVFLRSWINVECEKYYNPVTSLLIESPEKWKGMKTVGQIRYENKTPVPQMKVTLISISKMSYT